MSTEIQPKVAVRTPLHGEYDKALSVINDLRQKLTAMIQERDGLQQKLQESEMRVKGFLRCSDTVLIEALASQRDSALAALREIRDLCQITCLTPESAWYKATEIATKTLRGAE